MDQLDTGERRTKNLSELLHEAVEKEAINSDEQLMNSSKRGFNAQFFPKMSEVFSGAVQPKIFDENRRQRVYLLRKVMATLFPDGTIPQSLLEAGSAGDISVSLAFPDMDVESVDIDPDIFLSVSYNTLPDGFFKRIGKRRSIEGYGGKDWLGTKKRKLTMVQEALPKWKPVIEDAEELSAPDESQDIALVQGTPDMLDFFISQLARVTKPGGYIISMVDEQMREGEYTSAYEQQRYNDLPEFSFRTDEELAKLGLERVDVGEELRKYEKLFSKDMGDGTMVSTGYVFEIFRKIKAL